MTSRAQPELTLEYGSEPDNNPADEFELEIPRMNRPNMKIYQMNRSPLDLNQTIGQQEEKNPGDGLNPGMIPPTGSKQKKNPTKGFQPESNPAIGTDLDKTLAAGLKPKKNLMIGSNPKKNPMVGSKPKKNPMNGSTLPIGSNLTEKHLKKLKRKLSGETDASVGFSYQSKRLKNGKLIIRPFKNFPLSRDVLVPML